VLAQRLALLQERLEEERGETAGPAANGTTTRVEHAADEPSRTP
jgi:hypothetical protein